MRELWQAGTYWVTWLSLFTGTFLLREIWALSAGRPQDTLSEWVWNLLKITTDEPVGNWSATDYLVCGCWLVLVTWLTFHFFGRRFT